MDLLIEMAELAARVAQKEFPLDPDGEAEDVGEEQSAVKRDALEVVVQDQVASGREELHLAREPEAEREEDQRGNKCSIGDHLCPFCRHG